MVASGGLSAQSDSWTLGGGMQKGPWQAINSRMHMSSTCLCWMVLDTRQRSSLPVLLAAPLPHLLLTLMQVSRRTRIIKDHAGTGCVCPPCH